MTFDQYRDRKWTVTVFVGVVSAAGLAAGLVTSDDWAKVGIALVAAYPLESLMDKWLERRWSQHS